MHQKQLRPADKQIVSWPEKRLTRTSKYHNRLLKASRDPNEVMIVFDRDTEDRAREHAESASLKEARQRAGVLDQPAPHVHF